MKKAVTGFVCALLLMSLPAIARQTKLAKAEPGTWIVDDDGPADFSTIQYAINQANDGDVIFVATGTYYENVIVNRSVSLLGEDHHTTSVDANGTGRAICITKDNVNVTGFTITKSGSSNAQGAGVWIDHANRCNIFGNNFVANDFSSVSLWYSSYNTISGNNITETADYAITITQGSGNTISRNNIENGGGGVVIDLFSHYNVIGGNRIAGNRRAGVCLRLHSSNSTITRNDIQRNSGDGIEVYGDSNKIFENYVENSANGIWLYGLSNNVFRNYVIGSKYDGIVVDGSRNNRIFENNIGTNEHGMWLHGFSNSVIGNNLTGNQGFGLWLSNSLNNILRNNIQNNGYGLWLSNASNNTFYHNSVLNNTIQFCIVNSVNFWNSSFKEGNCWSDYSGIDSDLDGIGDTPYIIDASNQDNYPLISPYVSGDYNHDGAVNMTDAGMMKVAWQSRIGDLNYNPHVDFNMDGIINIKDATIIGVNWQKHA